MSLLDALVSYWSFDAGWNDLHGTNHLTNVNGVTAVAGLLGQAGQFARANTQYLSHVSNSDLQLGDRDWTIQLWVSPTGGGNQTFLAKDATTREYHLDFNSGNIRLYWVNGGVAIVSATPPTFTLGTWVLILAWYDATANTLNLQLNDAAVTTASDGGNVPPIGSDEFRIGYDGAGGVPFDGLIDEVAIWKRLLTPAERTALYHAGAGLAYPFAPAVPASTDLAPQRFRKTEGIHRLGLAAARPAAADVLMGTLYFSTDTSVLERSNGTAWEPYAGSGGGGMPSPHHATHEPGGTDPLVNAAWTTVANTFTQPQTITGTLAVAGAITGATDWVSIPFNAANFTGDGGMTWTVVAGNVTTFAYTLIKKTLTVAFVIGGTTLGGTLSNALRLTLPFTLAKTILSASGVTRNGGVLANCYVLAVAGGTSISLTKITETTFAVDSAFAAYGQITLEVT